MNRKVAALVAAVVGVAACGPAWAGWPDDKPIEVVIGFAPGGATDVMARKLLPCAAINTRLPDLIIGTRVLCQ